MAPVVTRTRAIVAGLMQTIGGILILSGTFVSRTESSPEWSYWLGLIVSIYFLATGGYRTNEAFKMPREPK